MKRILLTILLLFIPVPVSAQPALLPVCIHSGNCGICDIVDIIGNITQWMFYILGGAVLIVIFAGIGWFWILRQMGDADKIQEGKEVLKGCMWGAFFVLIAWQLVNVILFAFGTRLGSQLYKDQDVIAQDLPDRQITFKLFGNPWNYICDPNFGDLKKLADTAGYNQAVCFSRGDGTPCKGKTGAVVFDGICIQGVCRSDSPYTNACIYLVDTYPEYFGTGGARGKAKLGSYSCLSKGEVKDFNEGLKDTWMFYDCLSDTNLCPADGTGGVDLYCCGPVQREEEPYSN